MTVHVLRLGHRIARDKRITTHCALVSRALGAEKMIYTGQRDKSLEHSVQKMSNDFGGSFILTYTDNTKKTISDFQKNGKVAHLTVYGLPLQKTISRIRKQKKLLVVVGGEKVPPAVYQQADWNISVTSQPHSEIAALAVFLHEFFQGRELMKDFRNAKRKIVPQKRGKKIIQLEQAAQHD
jgi:tRNA (cytidine56-2'-O)-methyltransferase